MKLLLFRYHKTLEPGMNVLVPLIDKVKYVHSLKEITVDIPLQIAVTSGKTPFWLHQELKKCQCSSNLPISQLHLSHIFKLHSQLSL